MKLPLDIRYFWKMWYNEKMERIENELKKRGKK